MHEAPAARPHRATRLLLAAMLLAWTVVELGFARPATFAPHWRQADTQSIALTYARDGIDLLGPRIWWGGDGAGYVESEFMAYPAIVAVAMRAAGESELVPQLVSLAIGLAIALLLHHTLARRFGAIAGVVAAAVWATSRLGVQLSVAAMPDGLCALAWLAGLAWFLDYRDSGRLRPLVLAMLATALAGLVKPYALQLGIVQFVVLAAGARHRLRSVAPWLGWAAVLAVVGAWLWHAHGLYVAHGNSFGVLAGDTKFPSGDRLTDVRVYKDLVKVDLAFGVGVAGALGFAVLAVLRRLTAVEAGLVLANAVMLFVSIRYASDRWLGAHYHVFALLAGAWFTGRAAAEVAARWAVRWPPWARRLAATLIAAGAAALLVHHVREWRGQHHAAMQDPVLPLGEALRALRAPGELVAVRSAEDAFDPRWQRSDNYQDPRLLYVADARGWVLPRDRRGADAVRELAQRGARWYAEPREQPPRDDPELHAWLAGAAQLAHDGAAGRVWRLALR